jgi:hypothetical protein
VKIASAMSVANERLLDRVRHFVEPRLAMLAFERVNFGDRHWQSSVFGVCQAKRLSLSRIASGSDENHACASINLLLPIFDEPYVGLAAGDRNDI